MKKSKLGALFIILCTVVIPRHIALAQNRQIDITSEDSYLTTHLSSHGELDGYNINYKPSTVPAYVNSDTISIINKSELTDDLYKISLPCPDVTYDGKPHLAEAACESGVGEITFLYLDSDTNEFVDSPINAGTYNVYCEIAESSCYFGRERTFVGSFTIYNLSETDWAAIKSLKAELVLRGLIIDWDVSEITAVSQISEFTIERGRVISVNLSNYGLTEDFPSSIVRFTALRELNLSNNEFIGNPGILAAKLPQLKKLDVSNNYIRDLYPIISSSVEELILWPQSLDDYTMDIDLSNTTKEVLANEIPSILLYNHNTQSYDNQVVFQCTSADGWVVWLYYDNEKFTAKTLSEDYDYHGRSGDIFNVKALSSDYEELGTSKMSLEFEIGDANFNGVVDATDLQSTILHIFNTYNRVFNFTAADTFVDNILNVQDVVCTVNILLTNMQQSNDIITESNGMRTARCLSDVYTKAYIYAANGLLKLYSTAPIAALSIKTTGNVTWDIRDYGLTQTVANNTVVACSITGATIPGGETLLGTYSGTVDILNISLSDEEAQIVDVTILNDDHESNIHDVNVDTSVNTDLSFDLLGRCASGDSKGFLIIKHGNKNIKNYNMK